MDLQAIRNRLLTISPFVKDIEVIEKESHPFVTVYPDFEALKASNIININEEVKWYVVELYNLEVGFEERINGYRIILPEIKNELDDKDVNDETYVAIKTFISQLSDVEISPSSHLELDLGLDSLDYVELFSFLDKNFGIYVNEKIFSHMMTMQELYIYVKEHQKEFTKTEIKWSDILNEPIEDKLIYSPIIMFAYKTILFPLFKLYFKLEVKGIENIPEESCIFTPSHQSMLDGFLVESTLPYKKLKKTFFLAFELVFGTKVLGPISRNGQTILIDANNNLKLSMQKVAQPLKEKDNIVIFPEGARTRDRKLLEFRPFFSMLSHEYNVPVVPIVIDGSFEALPSGKLFPRPKKVSIRYLKPIYPNGLTQHELTNMVREAIQKDIDENPVLN